MYLVSERRLHAYLVVLLGVSGCKSGASESKAANQTTPAVTVPENEKAPALARPIGQGERAFDFTGLAHTGQRIRLSEFMNKPALVYFCPVAGSPPCTELAQGLRDEWLSLIPQLSMVLGVSGESTVVQREFAADLELPYLLIADQAGSVHAAMGQKPDAVASYLIGSDREVLKAFVPPRLADHGQEVLSALDALGLLQPPPPP
jgi:peroxiredoxin